MDGRKLRKFNRICNELADFMLEVHHDNENIELFIAGESTTSAMLIDTKGMGNDYWRKHQDECVLALIDIPYSDCGGV